MTESDESSGGAPIDELPPAPEPALPPDPPLPAEPALPAESPEPSDEPAPAPALAAPAPAPPPPAQPQGITVNGRFFAGATGQRRSSSGQDYHVYAITFPGRIEYWWYYFKGHNAGRWTGPHRAPGSGVSTGGREPTHPSTPTKPPPSAPAPSAPTPKKEGYYRVVHSWEANGNIREWHHYTSGSRAGALVMVRNLGAGFGKPPKVAPAGWRKPPELIHQDVMDRHVESVKYE